MDYIFLLIFIILQLILLSSVFKADSEIDENLLLSAFHSKRGQKTTKISYENIKNNTVLEADSRDYTKSKAASKETIIEHNEGIKAKSDFTSFLKSLQIDITSSLNTFEDKDLNITLSLNDIRKLMYEGIVDEYQALLLWEFAIEMTSEPNFKNKITSSILKRFTKNSAADMYLLNFIHIKSFFVFLTTVVVFLVLYKYLQRIQKSGRMNIRIGVIFLAISLYYSYVLYNWMYYISSNIIFIFFCLCLKYTIEIFVSRTYKLKKEDIDITKESDNDKMFNYKLSIILICGIIMVFLIVTKFNSLFNYIILYGILLKFFNLLTLRIQAYFPDELQPVSDLIFFFIGFGNFLITNIYRNNKDLNSIYDLPDSCYIISEIFTFITITSIFSYVKIQSFDWTSAELNENAKVKTREFTISDILWLLLFIIGFIIFFLSLRYNNYVSFIFGLHYFKHLFKLLNDIFKIKVIRVLFCLYLIILFMCLCILTSSTDIRLCVLFDIYNETFISISKFLLKVITLFYTVWIIKLVDKIIFINHEEDDSHITDNNGEVKKVEIRSEKISKKERVIKIQWYTCDANKLSLSIYDYIYVLSDMISNYLLIVYFLYMIKFLESSLFFKCLYCVVLITFLTRVSIIYIIP